MTHSRRSFFARTAAFFASLPFVSLVGKKEEEYETRARRIAELGRQDRMADRRIVGGHSGISFKGRPVFFDDSLSLDEIYLRHPHPDIFPSHPEGG